MNNKCSPSLSLHTSNGRWIRSIQTNKQVIEIVDQKECDKHPCVLEGKEIQSEAERVGGSFLDRIVTENFPFKMTFEWIVWRT